MSCKYDIIDEGGRKRVRALRHFTVQGRDVCPMELGGYVYDSNTLSQDGNCWIFSGSLEYPGVRVMDEAIVDMGNDTAKAAPRMKACMIRGNSRIMGAVSFESAPAEVLQTPAMFEQGGYSATVGMIPVKASDGSRIRIPASVFGGSVGKVAVTSAAHEARIISLDSDGLVTSAGAWTAGGPAVVLTTASPYFLVEVRKTPSAAITPADVTAAGITLTSARGSSLDINNSSIVPAYNGVPAVSSIMRMLSVGTGSLFNCSMRVECVYNQGNPLLFESDATKTNFFLTVSGGAQLAIRGFKLRNTNFYSRQSLPTVGPQGRVIFAVSDCPAFTYDPGTFPDAAGFLSSGKTFYFKNCNMPVGSAIHYYDPKVNVWDNIDFTKAMADLGKTAYSGTTLVSSNVQGMYRARGNTSGSIGGLVESASSFEASSTAGLASSYDSVIYKDCTLTGLIGIIGCNVFGGTLGGASKITNTTETPMVIDGSFRIEGNAQVTDTPLKGNGYIGGNAELKNGNVLGYVYMDGDSQVILPVNTSNFRRLIMRGRPKIMKIRTGTAVSLEMYGDAVLNAELIVGGGMFIMKDNSVIDSSGTINVNGRTEVRDNVLIAGTSSLTITGDVELIGGYKQSSGSYSIYGKRTISDVSQIGVVDLPPTKATW
nr:MAG TPA: Putative transferase, nesg, ydcK, Structural Genomics.38A [Caudoviricetes sp.]